MTWLLVGAGLVLFGGGMVTGLSLGRDRTADVVERQTELIGELQDGQRALVEAAARPVVLDAELRASLASTPVQCVAELGGDPMSIQCAWATCGAFGQSDAGRLECSQLTRRLVEAFDAEPEPTTQESAGER
jgi:hypothetical protein